MELRSEQELANTRKKLGELEALFAQNESDSNCDRDLREVKMDSLKRLINQLKEEIIRYELRQPTHV
jgi:hypothetical protein